MDNPEELELPEIYSFLPRCSRLAMSHLYVWKRLLLFNIGSVSILASTAAVSTATRASSSERLPVGLRFCRKRWLNQQKTGYCRMQRNSISCCLYMRTKR